MLRAHLRSKALALGVAKQLRHGLLGKLRLKMYGNITKRVSKGYTQALHVRLKPAQQRYDYMRIDYARLS
jgi:hypothetical protein